MNASQPNVSRGRWIRWRSKFGNQPQNVAEQILRDGDFGHLEGDIATVGHHLRADLVGWYQSSSSRRPSYDLVKLAHAATLAAKNFMIREGSLFRDLRYRRPCHGEADLVDQLFSSSEKRRARLLLLLANFGKDGRPEPLIAKISQGTLADMVGTTRSA